jgi:glycosyltransferase involved in cell wall biosynthesis
MGRRVKINIICDEPNDGWIYSKFIKQFKKYSKFEILVNSKENCDITHYIPYYNVPKNPTHPCTAWFSHMEQKEPLRTRFFTSAKQVDCAISHSKKYADLLIRMGNKNTTQVMPGVDLDKFAPKDNYHEINKNKPLVIGYIGRSYSSSNRKNPTLLNKISQLDGVDLRITGGKVKEEEMPQFYKDVDLIISPSKIEGGPMCIIEALAVGKPIICFDSVGVAEEFDFGLIKVADFNEERFIKIIEDWRDGKLVLNPPKILATEKMREQVIKYSWETFVNKHDEIWNKLCNR